MEDSKLWPAPDKWVPSCFVWRGDGRQQTVASPRQVSTELFCLAWWWKTANCGQPQTSEYRVVLFGVVMEDSKLWPAPDKWVPSCFVRRGDGRQQTVASPRQVSTELFCLAWWWKTANCGQPQTSEYRVVLFSVVMEDSKLWPAPDKWVPSCFVWRGDGRQQTVASPRQVSTELFC